MRCFVRGREIRGEKGRGGEGGRNGRGHVGAVRDCGGGAIDA